MQNNRLTQDLVCIIRIKGMTFIEVMIVIAIAGILAAVAAPSFKVYIANNKGNEIAFALASTFNRAKTEAITRSATVTVCSLANPIPSNQTCTTFGCTCGSASNWNNGWMINIPSSNTQIAYNVQTDLNTIQVGSGSFTFQPNGMMTGSTTVFTIKPTSCTHGYTTTIFSPIGHVQVCPNPNNPNCSTPTCP